MMKYVMVLFGLSLVSSAYADEGVIQIDKSKLMRVADTLGVTSFLEVSEDDDKNMQLARQAADSFAASPSDLESGDFEIKCQTTCGFAKSGAFDEKSGGGEAALAAAKDLAKIQDELKAVQSELMDSPGNAGLQAKEIHLQSLVQDKVQALQAAAGLPASKSNLETTAVALASAKKKLEAAQEKYETEPTPALEAAMDLMKAEVARLEAVLKSQKNPNNDLEGKIAKMKERLTSLKAALSATPEDASLKDEIKMVEDELAKQSEGAAFQPKATCQRVCMQHEEEGGSGEGGAASPNCIRMCVKVMRHLVFHLAQDS